MRILVSGGPTYEYLDDVRFLGNPATGAVALAVAEAARAAGHQVVLVLGPTHLGDPPGTQVIRVVSALEMRDALLAALPDCDALVMAAAVSDYRPARRVPGKMRKGAGTLELELTKNPDILSELSRMAANRPVVGFALEAAPLEEALASAREKLTRKGCRLVVLNRPGSFGGAWGEEVHLVSRGEAVPLGRVSKKSLGERLVRYLEEGA